MVSRAIACLRIATPTRDELQGLLEKIVMRLMTVTVSEKGGLNFLCTGVLARRHSAAFIAARSPFDEHYHPSGENSSMSEQRN